MWVLEEWEKLISDPEADMAERISAWSFRVAVAAGLRWNDLLNSTPNTLILTTGGLTGFAAKTKTRGVSEGRPWGASDYAYSNEKWMLDGYTLFMSHSGNLNRDFWIGQPMFSEIQNGFFNNAPAFWSIANKLMIIPPERANFQEVGHGIMPLSLKVAAISALTTEIVKGKGNLAQLSAQWNYRAITAADMGKIYPRNIAQQQLYVSKFSQKAVRENQNAEPALAVANVPGFEEVKNPDDSNARNKEADGEKPRDWALELLKSRQESDVLKRSSETLREASIETFDPDGQRDSTPTIVPEPTQAKKKERKVI